MYIDFQHLKAVTNDIEACVMYCNVRTKKTCELETVCLFSVFCQQIFENMTLILVIFNFRLWGLNTSLPTKICLLLSLSHSHTCSNALTWTYIKKFICLYLQWSYLCRSRTFKVWMLSSLSPSLSMRACMSESLKESMVSCQTNRFKHLSPK